MEFKERPYSDHALIAQNFRKALEGEIGEAQ
jgi:hypothetical protein